MGWRTWGTLIELLKDHDCGSADCGGCIFNLGLNGRPYCEGLEEIEGMIALRKEKMEAGYE